MSVYVDRAGTFRGRIFEYGAKQTVKTGTWALGLKAALDEWWDPGEESTPGFWVDWKPYNMEVEGYLNIIKKDGNWNEANMPTIVKYAGWDGSFTSLDQKIWKPEPCQFDIKLDSYDDTLRIAWLAAYNRVPGTMGNLNTETAKDLDAKHHSSLRALTGNMKRAETKPQGTPPAPPVNPPEASADTCVDPNDELLQQ